jgi:NAD(P)-dependent dehydrogenase (short-subunit alcohol dehydrogenase family)
MDKNNHWWIDAADSLKGKTAVIICGNNKLSWQVGEKMATLGCELIMAIESEHSAKKSMNRIKRFFPHAKIRFEYVDPESLVSIKRFTRRLVDYDITIDILLNGAVPSQNLFDISFENQYGNTVICHCALTLSLLPLLLKSTSPRITTMIPIPFDCQQGRTYDHSKLAMLTFALELHRKTQEAGINLVSNAALFGSPYNKLNKAEMLHRIFHWFLGIPRIRLINPVLHALVDRNQSSGILYGYENIFFDYEGQPNKIDIPAEAQSALAATQLWEAAESAVNMDL